jgi:hypothetical protein
MKHQSKLSSGQQQESAVEQQAAQQATRDFSSPEELLRHDAARTQVPSAVVQRIGHSIQGLPRPRPRSWWQRFFGGSPS